MPYIPQNAREYIRSNYPSATSGELNFLITDHCHEYIKRSGGMSYSKINEVIGVLECAKLEMYRMLAAPYEDGKREQHGPVSDLDREVGE